MQTDLRAEKSPGCKNNFFMQHIFKKRKKVFYDVIEISLWR